ncbi:MAG: TIGR04013 family B12-binding domain/radical SAM domain-containing protein [Planctomycetota bacterium]
MIVFFYNKPNRHGFNALAGALEADPFCKELPVSFPTGEESLFRAINEALAEADRVLVGLSFMTPQLAAMKRLARRLKEEFARRITLVAGGPHPTADPAGTLALGCDIVVRGEGEATFQELVKQIFHSTQRAQRNAEGNHRKGLGVVSIGSSSVPSASSVLRIPCYAAIQGLAFRDESGAIRLTKPRPWIDLDDYPPLAAGHHKVGAIEITRGCPHACGFCQTSQLHGTRPRHRSVARLVEAVEWMSRNQLRDVRLLSPSAFSYGSPDGRRLNLAAIAELLSGLRRALGPHGRLFFGSFPSEARPEHVTPETLELLRKYASNNSILIGAQSGSDATLERCHRGHTMADVFAAASAALQAGFKVNVDFILGLPGETEPESDQTAAALEKLAALGARIHAHFFLPLPQTAFAGAKPSHPSKRLLATVYRLLGRGQLYGEWQAQTAIAETAAD